MKRLCTSALTALFCVVILSFPVVAVSPGVGDIIEFGGYDWRVLDVQDDKALIISEDIIEHRPYNVKGGVITWEHSTIRQYLNGDFYNSFSSAEQGRIVETTIINSDNPTHGTAGGNDTIDNIFLLSIDEAQTYFTDDASRIAVNADGESRLWWLRSPGLSAFAAFVNFYGLVYVNGNFVYNLLGGVRPALWLEMKQPADTGAGGAGAAAALFLVCAAVCVKSVRRK